MKNRNRRNTVRVVTPEEKKQYAADLEKTNPGYLNENVKLSTMVWTLTGMRMLYSVFFLYITFAYEINDGTEWMNFLSTFIFLCWYSWMLRSGKIIAILMLLFRGVGIVTSGVSLLSMAMWPLSLIFTLTFAIAMEFAEAVFCIYVLFNGTAAQTIRLNKEMDRTLLSNGVSKTTLGTMAEYKNTYGEEMEIEKPENEKKENTDESDGREEIDRREEIDGREKTDEISSGRDGDF